MLISPAAANSYFTYCESDREESGIDSIIDDGNDISDDFKKKMKGLGQEVKPKDNQIGFKEVELIL